MLGMLLRILILSGWLCFAVGCRTEQKSTSKPEYMRFVGDISLDSKIDDPSFRICNTEGQVMQYFNTGEGFRYKGEKPALAKKIKEEFIPAFNVKNQSGYIRIRFIVNCKGETGRFRILASDPSYQQKDFDKAIANQLVTIVKGLDGWHIMTKDKIPLDYYLYLIFKLENGRITEILP